MNEFVASRQAPCICCDCIAICLRSAVIITLAGVESMARQVHERRRPASADNPYRQLEQHSSQQISAVLDSWRRIRDTGYALPFKAFYQ